MDEQESFPRSASHTETCDGKAVFPQPTEDFASTNKKTKHCGKICMNVEIIGWERQLVCLNSPSHAIGAILQYPYQGHAIRNIYAGHLSDYHAGWH